MIVRSIWEAPNETLIELGIQLVQVELFFQRREKVHRTLYEENV